MIHEKRALKHERCQNGDNGTEIDTRKRAQTDRVNIAILFACTDIIRYIIRYVQHAYYYIVHTKRKLSYIIEIAKTNIARPVHNIMCYVIY